MKKSIILIFIIYLIISCNQKENRPEPIKDITFNIGSNTRSKFIGVVPSKGNTDEFIYFADPASKKIISLFNLSGQLIDSIPLKESLTHLGSIDGIAFISKDTIIINSEYTNKIITINKQGKCWYKPDIKSQIIDSNQNVYEIFRFSNTYFATNSNAILYHSSYRYNINERLNNKEPSQYLENVKHYYDKSYESAYFVKILNYFSKTPKIEFAFYDFYKRMSNIARVFLGSANYISDNKYIYVFSCYSDKLFVLNTNTLELVKEIKISSKYTSIGYNGPQINEKTINHIEELINRPAKTKGRIDNMFYNVHEDQYYLIVLHNVLDEKEKLKNRPIRHFSVIVYDKQFENPKEYAFTDEAYKHYPCLMSSQGLLLAKTPPKFKINDQIVFTLFKF